MWKLKHKKISKIKFDQNYVCLFLSIQKRLLIFKRLFKTLENKACEPMWHEYEKPKKHMFGF